MVEKLPKLDDTFPKLLPQLRGFVSSVESHLREGKPLAPLSDELRQCDIVMSALVVAFRMGVQGYDYDERDLEFIAQIYADFKGIGGVLSSLFCDLKAEDREGTVRDLCALVDQLRQTEATLERLDSYKEKKPRESEYIQIDSVMRAGKAVLEGRRDWEILETCLGYLRPSFEKLAACPSLPVEAEDYCEVLDELFRTCENRDLESLGANLEAFRQASQILFEKYESLKVEREREERQQQWHCLKCGRELNTWDKRCPQCGMKAPERLMWEEAQEVENNVALPPCVRALVDCVASLRSGEDCWAVWEGAMRELALLIQELQERYQNLPDEAFRATENVEALILSREALEEGLAKLLSAQSTLERMSQGTLAPAEIDGALEALVEGIEQTRQLAPQEA